MAVKQLVWAAIYILVETFVKRVTGRFTVLENCYDHPYEAANQKEQKNLKKNKRKLKGAKDDEAQ